MSDTPRHGFKALISRLLAKGLSSPTVFKRIPVSVSREYLASPTVFLEAFAKRNPKTMPDGKVTKQIVSTIGSQK